VLNTKKPLLVNFLGDLSNDVDLIIPNAITIRVINWFSYHREWKKRTKSYLCPLF